MALETCDLITTHDSRKFKYDFVSLENLDADSKLCVMQGTRRISLRVISNEEHAGTLTLADPIH